MVQVFVLFGPSGVALGTTLLAALGFLGLGRLVALIARDDARDTASVAYDVVAGWGIASFVLIAAALARIPLAWASMVLGVLGLAGLVLRSRDRLPALGSFFLVAALTLPILALASVSPPTMYDDFGHWLPNARFVYEHGALPGIGDPNLWSDMPSYPYGGPFVDYLASLLGGRFIPQPTWLFTVLLFGLLGLAGAESAAGPWRRLPPIGWLAGGIAVAILLNPTFDPRLALSALMDTPSGALLALATLATWRAIGAFEENNEADGLRWFVRAGFCGLALVYARDTNLVLLVGLGLGLLAAGLPLVRGRCSAALRQSCVLVLIPAAGFGLWRSYQASAHLRVSAPILPLAQWQWNAPLALVEGLLGSRLLDNPVRGGAALAVLLAALALAAWMVARSPGRARSLVVLLAVIAATWLAFVAWAYIAVVPGVEAKSIPEAQGLWRYIGELGPAVLLLLIPAARLLRGHVTMQAGIAAVLATGIAIAVLGAPLALPSSWRNECTFSDIAAAGAYAQEAGLPATAGKDIVLTDQADPLWMAVALQYDLHRPAGHVVGLQLQAGAAFAGQDGPVWDFRALDAAAIRSSGMAPRVTVSRPQEAAASSFGPLPARNLCGLPLFSLR